MRHALLPAIAVTAGAVLLVTGVSPATAQADRPRLDSTVHTIDKHADSTGPIVVDSSGHGYVAWASTKGNSNGDSMWFCKIPKGGTCTKPLELPLPAGANWDSYRVNQPFPVLGGKAGVVSIVGPSYDFGNVVVWTSHNSGKSFDKPQVISSADYDGTTTDDVLRSPDADAPYYPDYFSIASTGPGLFYTFTGIGAIGALDPPSGFAFDTSSVPGAVTTATEGYGETVNPGDNQSTQTVEAFSTDADKPRLDYYWSPVPGVSGSPGSLEKGPISVGYGINPRLAGGPDGLFLLSADYVASPSNDAKPLHLDVRKWDAAKETFGPPTLVAKIPNDINASNPGGFAEDDSTGVLTVAWPTETSSGGYVISVWTSANKAKTFTGPTVAGNIDYAYSGPARVASTGDSGFVTWQDSDGLRLVDLSHL